mmetsp:Transcript_25837/g.85115  ORF Transcript_25837/g.85115 Transcript_25837/m.85115 type:complete len:215 (-) Transcript_25837:342-986(-)
MLLAESLREQQRRWDPKVKVVLDETIRRLILGVYVYLGVVVLLQLRDHLDLHLHGELDVFLLRHHSGTSSVLIESRPPGRDGQVLVHRTGADVCHHLHGPAQLLVLRCKQIGGAAPRSLSGLELLVALVRERRHPQDVGRIVEVTGRMATDSNSVPCEHSIALQHPSTHPYSAGVSFKRVLWEHERRATMSDRALISLHWAQALVPCQFTAQAP